MSTGFALFVTVAAIALTNLVGRQLDLELFPFALAVAVFLGIAIGVTQGLVSLAVCLAALIGAWLRPELLPESGRNAVALHSSMAIAGTLVAGGIVLYSGRVRRRFDTLLKRSRALANIDSLTGLSNRRHAEEMLSRELKRSARSGHTFSILFLDIDHFKQINDTLGHAVGDAVLKEFVGVVRQHLREYDIVARWGGDEFLVILPETSNDDVLRVAERIRSAVSRQLFTGEALVTISMGVGSLEPDDTTDSLLDRADSFLLKAKQQGRNKTLW